jgi:hypothetical protein
MSVPKVNTTSATRSVLYSRHSYIALCGIPGQLVAALLIKVNGLGRKRTGAGIADLTGIFKLLTAVSRSAGAALALVYYNLLHLLVR